MPSWVSNDGKWKVTPISLNGVQLLRVESSSLQEAVKPVPGTGMVRPHVVKSAGSWYWIADVKTVADVEAWVPLEELNEQK